MYKALTGAIIVLGLTGAAVVTAPPASAAFLRISLNLGDVAFGYQEGYWDRNHRWHNWRNEREAARYRASSGNHYNDWKHDRDPDKGWHQ
jgi:hypothetical protein